MPQSGFHRIEEIFHQAIKLPHHERAAFVDEACAGDAAIRQAVNDLLRHDETLLAPDDAFLASPIKATADQVRHDHSTRRPGGGLDITLTNWPFIPGFEFLAELGRGGMGVVYQAKQLNLNRIVALKMLLPSGRAESDHLKRFRSEAELLARMNQPNIIPIYDVGECEGRPYFTMEFVPGPSLARYLSGKAQPPAESARLIEILARAIHGVHEKGIIHRDIKPSNVLLQFPDAKGNSTARANPVLSAAVPKITDFGLAKDRASSRELTQAGTAMGTPGYMPPEQARCRADQIGPAVDIYALGAILYEMLTGRPPFDAATPSETIAQLLTEDPIAPSRLRPGLPSDLATIALKCLEKAPAKRYASAQDLADDLQRFQENQPILARPIGPIARAIRWCRRRPTVAALTALCAALAITFAVTVISYQIRLKAALAESRDLAEVERTQIVQLNINLADEEWEVGDIFAALLRLAEAARIDNSAAPSVPDLPDRIRIAWSQCPRPAHIHEQFQPAICARAIGNGLWVASIENERTLEIRDVKTDQVLQSLPISGPVPMRGALSADGAWFATLDAFGSARLWNLREKTAMDVPLEGGSVITAIVFPDKSPVLVSRHADSSVRFWDRASAGLVARPTSKIKLRLSDGGRWLFSTDGDSLSSVGDASTRRVACKLKLPPNVARVEFSEQAQLIVVVDHDQSVRCQPVAGDDVRMLHHHLKGTITHARFSPDGRQLALADSQGFVRIWDTATWLPITPLLRHGEQLVAVDFSPDGRELYAVNAAGSVRSWDFNSKLDVANVQVQKLTALAELLARSKINEHQESTKLSANELRDRFEVVKKAMPESIKPKNQQDFK